MKKNIPIEYMNRRVFLVLLYHSLEETKKIIKDVKENSREGEKDFRYILDKIRKEIENPSEYKELNVFEKFMEKSSKNKTTF